MKICCALLAISATAVCLTAASGCGTPTKREGRAKLWSSTCGRCHLMRSPSSLSDAEWEVVVQHMRMRAYLTPEEAKAIAEFLKAGNN